MRTSQIPTFMLHVQQVYYNPYLLTLSFSEQACNPCLNDQIKDYLQEWIIGRNRIARKVALDAKWIVLKNVIYL